jgi:hypothetical protein
MAVTDRASLKGHADTTLADNTSGDISAADVRDLIKDIADSALNRVTDKGVLFPVFKTMTGQTVLAAGSVITHNMTVPVRILQCTNSSGESFGVVWEVDGVMPNSTVNVTAGSDQSGVTINMIGWT